MKDARSLGTAQELKDPSETLVNPTPVLERSAAIKAEKRNSTRAFLLFLFPQMQDTWTAKNDEVSSQCNSQHSSLDQGLNPDCSLRGRSHA